MMKFFDLELGYISSDLIPVRKTQYSGIFRTDTI